MQVTIVNRLKDANNKIIQDVNVKIPELISALWNNKPSKMRLLFSKPPKKPPTPEHVQQMMNFSILNNPTLKFSQVYGKRLSGVELISNNTYWANLIIDEQRYFEGHSKKNTSLIDELISAHSVVIKPLPPAPKPSEPLPELRPKEEVNPIYPSLQSTIEIPKKESNLSIEKNKNNVTRLLIHAVAGLALSLACSALGLSWLIALPALAITNLVIFLAMNHFQTKVKVPVAEKNIPPETVLPSSQPKSTNSAQLPIPDNLSILFSRNSSKPQPLATAPSNRALASEPPTPRKMANNL